MKEKQLFNGRSVRLYTTTEAIGLLWEENPRSGDIGMVMKSIAFNGFLSLPILSPSLTNVSGGTGAIAIGNHRVTALHHLWQAGPEYWEEVGRKRWCPTMEQGGEWLCPVLTVPHLDTEEKSIAAAIDDNNTALGGDFSASDRLRLWEPQAYADLLERLLLEDPRMVSTEDPDNLAYYLSCLKDAPEEEVEEEETQERADREDQPRHCPHCGGEL